ncbi:CRISPR-associated endonuclease Cas2 [Candidatus Giovannonibacteria bacterium]|nr:CRISPR-associated endonuclease Cas2 [Candidatus Giovannonibacteria bacterium]
MQMFSLLAAGLVLGYARDKRTRNELLKECDKIWLSMDQNLLFELVRRFKFNKLISIDDIKGKKYIKLSERGRRKALEMELGNIKLNVPKRWDKKWRFVVFDIPEPKRKIRDALRRRLKALGFCEFQKSVFAFPYPCEKEINMIINFFGLRENVRYLNSSISYDADLRKYFKI